jgi:hypothetical protein
VFLGMTALAKYFAILVTVFPRFATRCIEFVMSVEDRALMKTSRTAPLFETDEFRSKAPPFLAAI